VAAASTLPAYTPETNAVVLLDDVNVRVLSPTEYLEHYRRVVKILRPEGRDEADLLVYLEGKEKLHSIHCWSFDRSGKEFELKDKEFTERGVFFGFELYNDVRMRTGTCPGQTPVRYLPSSTRCSAMDGSMSLNGDSRSPSLCMNLMWF